MAHFIECFSRSGNNCREEIFIVCTRAYKVLLCMHMCYLVCTCAYKLLCMHMCIQWILWSWFPRRKWIWGWKMHVWKSTYSGHKKLYDLFYSQHRHSKYYFLAQGSILAFLSASLFTANNFLIRGFDIVPVDAGLMRYSCCSMSNAVKVLARVEFDALFNCSLLLLQYEIIYQRTIARDD